jgi:hypothetical protein
MGPVRHRLSLIKSVSGFQPLSNEHLRQCTNRASIAVFRCSSDLHASRLLYGYAPDSVGVGRRRTMCTRLVKLRCKHFLYGKQLHCSGWIPWPLVHGNIPPRRLACWLMPRSMPSVADPVHWAVAGLLVPQPFLCTRPCKRRSHRPCMNS